MTHRMVALAFCIILISSVQGMEKEQPTRKKYVMEKAPRPAPKDEDSCCDDYCSLCQEPCEGCCTSCEKTCGKSVCVCGLFCMVVCCCQDFNVFPA